LRRRNPPPARTISPAKCSPRTRLGVASASFAATRVAIDLSLNPSARSPARAVDRSVAGPFRKALAGLCFSSVAMDGPVRARTARSHCRGRRHEPWGLCSQPESLTNPRAISIPAGQRKVSLLCLVFRIILLDASLPASSRSPGPASAALQRQRSSAPAYAPRCPEQSGPLRRRPVPTPASVGGALAIASIRKTPTTIPKLRAAFPSRAA